MKLKLILGLLTALFLSACAGEQIVSVQVIEPPIPARSVLRANQGWRLVDKGALLIDVRDPEVFAHSHIERAINVPLPELVARHKSFKVKKNQLIVVYGTMSARAGVTRSLLVKNGYANAHDAGSFEDMVAVRPGALIKAWSYDTNAHLIQKDRALRLTNHKTVKSTQRSQVQAFDIGAP